MRFVNVGFVVVVFAGVTFGCAAPDIGTQGYHPSTKSTKGGTGGDATNNGDNTGGNNAGNTPNNGDNAPANPAPSSSTTTTPPVTTPPTEFCDDAKTIPGTKLLDDPLSTEQGLFAPAQGFPSDSWSISTTGLHQSRVIDQVDGLVFNKDTSIGDVEVEVRAASTAISSTINPRLRQMFIVMGTTVAANGEVSALGCGVEVVQGETVEQKTSVVRFAGPPTAIGTSVLERVDRAALQVNEEFTMKARLSKGTLTCSVTQAATTTASANNLGEITGAVGFFTRQTQALFKNAHICKLK